MEALFVIQLIVSVILTIFILLQRSDSGLGSLFGGSVTEAFRTRRGFEAFLYNSSIFLAVIFVANSIAITITSAS